MVFETESFFNKTATQQPINTISIQNRRFQYDRMLSTSLLYLIMPSKFNLYSSFISSSLSATPSKQSALTVFEQKKLVCINKMVLYYTLYSNQNPFFILFYI
ncbi:hypothetical protein BC952_0001 [Flavobacterium limicola]|uniref:Uncharacterized protein n=1 Tax=Flavobacterium limicola TaxID=180441 RepID=A0A495S476_9FLAO|nr:hypothetical protein BC952_0001 [Flavobacterium limicola]